MLAGTKNQLSTSTATIVDNEGRASLEDRAHVVIAHNVFSSEECRHIIQIAENIGFERAMTVGDDHGPCVDDIRTNDISHLTRSPETQFIYERLFQKISHVNNRHFQTAVFALGEITVCRYSSTSQQHYGWHVDQMLVQDTDKFQRKLSTTTLLNDPDQFEGGCLNVALADWDADHNPGRAGDTTVFPAFTTHRVTPVTKGVRYSMVAWFVGPKWIQEQL